MAVLSNIEIMERAAAEGGTTPSAACKALGKNAGTFAVIKARGTSPAVDVYADMLAACGWGLAAMPLEDIPAGARLIQGRKSRDGILPDVLPPNSR